MSLVRETVDGLGQLMSDHIKLARVEIVTDAKSYGRQLAVLLSAAFVLTLGYGLGCVAGGLALARLWGGPLAFTAIGGFHLILGSLGVASALKKMRGAQILHQTVSEVSRSVSALATNGTALPAASSSTAVTIPDRVRRA